MIVVLDDVLRLVVLDETEADDELLLAADDFDTEEVSALLDEEELLFSPDDEWSIFAELL